MAATQCMLRLQIQQDTQAIRPRALHRGPPRDDTAGRRLVVVAHLAALLSVGALVIGLTFGSIAMARCCIGIAAASGAAATAPNNGGGSRTDTKEAVAGSSR